MEKTVDEVVNARLTDVGAGACITAGLAGLLVLGIRWGRWRGKRNQKKRTPELPGFRMSWTRKLLGRRTYQVEYLG